LPAAKMQVAAQNLQDVNSIIFN